MHNLDLDSYIKEAEEIEKMYMELLKLAQRKTESGIVYRIDSNSLILQRKILRRYEVWFEICRRFVYDYSDHEETANYETFIDEYGSIVDLIKLNSSSLKAYYNNSRYLKPTFKNQFISLFDTQVNILHTIKPIIYLSNMNYKKIISADLLNSEIEEAEMLFEREFIRPAGIIAGIVLERYLKTLCEINNIELGPKDTMFPMAQKLRNSEKVPDFDLSMLKAIDHLASLRNKCAHPKEEPKKHEVRELIDKTKKITFMAFS